MSTEHYAVKIKRLEAENARLNVSRNQMSARIQELEDDNARLKRIETAARAVFPEGGTCDVEDCKSPLCALRNALKGGDDEN